MASRKSLMHPVVEELRNGSPSASTPLRRRSSLAHRPVSADLKENDDEAERLIRRSEQSRTSSPRQQDKRRSMDLGLVAQLSSPQIAARISECIKLSAENKINTKNAFSLEMIDFMTYMIKKKDGNMCNLQMASMSLEVSTKIYGFRVDGVHTDILKMAGVTHHKPDKGAGRRENQRGDGEGLEGNGEGDGPGEAPNRLKKKRKSKQKILSTAAALKGTVETINPASLMFDHADSQTTDLLYQAIMPYHATGDYYLNLHNDVILDTVDPTKELAVNTRPIECPRIENFSDDDHICQSFANFEFLGWSHEDEIDTPSQEKSQSFQEDLQFDLNASLPPDEESHHAGTNYFDIEGDGNVENVQQCRGDPNRSRELILDFTEVIRASTHNRDSEYSYFAGDLDFQWNAPSHWKIKFPNKNPGGSRIVEGCAQKAASRRRELVLSFNDDVETICDNKSQVTHNNLFKLPYRTTENWSEEKITLPQDLHYDSQNFSKYYLRRSAPEMPIGDQMNATHVSDEIGDYDYNNEHDTTDYCPNMVTDDQPPNDEGPNNPNGFDEELGPVTQAFTGDNLVEAPKVNSKIFIPFSQRAKKIDMRQLKKAIWKLLTATNPEKENAEAQLSEEQTEKIIGTKTFSTIYKNLPKTLSKTNAEALSFPIAVVSLLHLANEKCLDITSNEDNSDFFIRQE